MRFITVNHRGTPVIAVEDEEGLRPLEATRGRDLGAVLRDGDLAQLAAPAGGALLDPTEVEILAPVRPGKIVAIGLNYMDHVRESGRRAPRSSRWCSRSSRRA